MFTIMMVLAYVLGVVGLWTLIKTARYQAKGDQREREAARARARQTSPRESAMPVAMAIPLLPEVHEDWSILARVIDLGVQGLVQWETDGRSLRGRVVDPHRIRNQAEEQWIKTAFGSTKPGQEFKKANWRQAQRTLRKGSLRELERAGLITRSLDPVERRNSWIIFLSNVCGLVLLVISLVGMRPAEFLIILSFLPGLIMLGVAGISFQVLREKVAHATPAGERVQEEVAGVERLVELILAEPVGVRGDQLQRLMPWATLFGKADALFKLMMQLQSPPFWLVGPQDPASNWENFLQAGVKAMETKD